jgi:flagellar hook protein FlgE
MFEPFYVGMTGLDSYAKGLNVISNNVANLNTPGFKGSQLQFADLYYKNSDAGVGNGQAREQIGSGVGTGSTFLNFQQGEARQTGGDLDLLIDGAGLFVLRKDGETSYSRAGQFEFDKDGFLVDQTTRSRVAAMDGSGQLADLSITGLRASPPKATTKVTFTGNLSTADTQHIVNSMTVHDALGGATTFKLTFDNTNAVTPGSWKITVTASDGTVAGTGEIRFSNGKPQLGFDSMSFSYAPQGAEPLAMILDFTTDVTSFSAGTDSTLSFASQDGYAAGSLVKASFDVDGNFVTTYSNGQEEKHGRLALAWFTHTDALEQVGGNRFVSRYPQPAHLGRPGEGEFGKITARSIESSNVDLSQQFSEMIITQRGYQASSQVITTANEMIQQLLDMRGKR